MFGLGKKKSDEKTKPGQEPGQEPKPAQAGAETGPDAPTSDAPSSEASSSAIELLAPPTVAEGGGVMPAQMQDWPINVANILEHAAVQFADQEIVTALIEGGMHRQTFAETLVRTKKLANALRRLGVRPGDRVATLAWNTHRHIEAWYAISGQGAICHTVNPRLFPEQVGYIINHAGNGAVFFDITFAPLVAALRDKLPGVKYWIAMTDRAHMPEGDYLCFEELVAPESALFEWPALPDDAASSLCYTSGTTGEPKGVLYGHRSNLLMAMSQCSKDVMNLGAQDVGLMVVPMFHANSWGMAYSCPMVGCKMVLPGMALDGASVHRMIKEEKVTMSAAVPTVWSMLLDHLEKTGGDLSPLTDVAIGGSAVPRSMIQIFEEKYNVEVIHAWGMTEMSPLGSLNRLLPAHDNLSKEEKLDVRCKQGRPMFGVEMKIVNDEGVELPRDGVAFGRLLVRGPWVVKSYFGREDEQTLDADGWFDTGDVATLDPQGLMQITDRAKDVIKSGGEWISSLDLENAAVAHPDVAMACVIGVAHPKWEERPLLLVVAKEGATPDKASVLGLLGETFAKWQLPDDMIVVDELPLTATGKLDKKVLRETYADHLMSAADADADS